MYLFIWYAAKLLPEHNQQPLHNSVCLLIVSEDCMSFIVIVFFTKQPKRPQSWEHHNAASSLSRVDVLITIAIYISAQFIYTSPFSS